MISRAPAEVACASFQDYAYLWVVVRVAADATSADRSQLEEQDVQMDVVQNAGVLRAYPDPIASNMGLPVRVLARAPRVQLALMLCANHAGGHAHPPHAAGSGASSSASGQVRSGISLILCTLHTHICVRRAPSHALAGGRAVTTASSDRVLGNPLVGTRARGGLLLA